jgi:hypothetical protein
MDNREQLAIFKRYLNHSLEMIENASRLDVLNQNISRAKTLYMLMNDLNLITYRELYDNFLNLEKSLSNKTKEINERLKYE